MSKHVPDIDNDGKKFNEDAYFRKLGLTKAERTSNDRWEKARQKYRDGAIPHIGQTVLDLRSANDWLQRSGESAAAVRKLFGDFWLEGELAILFADTGKGKSILAVQIAESLARGRAIEPFEMDYKPTDTLGSDWPQTPILYLDFELSTDQFNRRYSVGKARSRRRRFHRNFIRAELRTDEAIPPAFKDLGAFLAHSIRNAVAETEARVLIIDNISWLRTSNTNASAALELMRELKTLKTRENLSILVLAHTPKRSFAGPLTVNDLAGSKMLANFADSIFAIGDSIQGSNVRYLKQIKPRSTPLIYDATNVAVARILSEPPAVAGGLTQPARRKATQSNTEVQPPATADGSASFLRFAFTGFANEAEHLIRTHYRLSLKGGDGAISASDVGLLEAENFRRKLIANCKEMSDKGHTQRRIAETLGISQTTVRRYLSENRSGDTLVPNRRMPR